MKIRLLSTNLKSSSLKRLSLALSAKLGYKVFRSINTKPNREHLRYGDQKDKIAQYEWFKAQAIPALEFTTEKQTAQNWLSEGHAVFARTLTRASEGKGIVVYQEEQELGPAPVYTKYKKKKKEFRVHVFKDKVVAILEKRLRNGWEGEKNAKVRNTANGYVFCSQNVEEPEGLCELALKASKVTQSDFKGVDIGWNEKKQELFVIEVNSAPGIEGTNVDRYVQTIVNSI